MENYFKSYQTILNKLPDAYLQMLYNEIPIFNQS